MTKEKLVEIAKGVASKVSVAVLTAAILGLFALAWNAVSSGGLVRAMGGITDLDLENAGLIPSGVVLAFDRPQGCPAGWNDMGDEWHGKFLVVAVPETDDQYGFRRTGGAATHTLTVQEIPSHDHQQIWGQDVSQDRPHASGNNLRALRASGMVQRTNATGGGQSHNNLPPYVALFFCKRP